MKKTSIFGILILLAMLVVLGGCVKPTGKAYNVNDDLIVSGKAGIGTTSPGSKLDVVGGDEIVLRVAKTASGTPAAIVSGGYIIMDGGAYGIRGGTGQGMYLGANNADIIYISTQGNVGIGTTSPAARLEITSGGNPSPNLQINSAEGRGIKIDKTGGGETILYLTQNDAYNNNFFEAYGGGETPLLAKINGLGGAYFAGEVGIGTTTPVDELQIHSVSSYPDIRLTTNATGATTTDGTLIEVGASGNFYILNYENAPITFSTNGANEKMRIEAGGNVGIGTASPTARLSVKGDNSGNHIFNAAAINGPDALTIYSDGNIYIGAKQTDYGAKGAKLKMTSLSGDYWCCGPNNAGAWSCTATKGSCY